MTDGLLALVKQLRSESAAHYCRHVDDALGNDLLQGETSKLASGQFGAENLRAHREHAERYGKHVALNDAANRLEALAALIAQPRDQNAYDTAMEATWARLAAIVAQLQKEKNVNALIQEWKDANGCAAVWTPETLRYAGRVQAAGEAIIKDYEKAIENLHREAGLAVRLRQKLEEVAGPEVASSVV